ncbi:MAG: DNA/RNA nuclease SfsA [Spirochaetes bacterium]|nr:DNA/RNA nuclease SfsA [Spirochaetota bacterium]
MTIDSRIAAPARCVEAELIARHNRFVASVRLRGRALRVYVPNTGRLSELALPGSRVLLLPSPGKYPYRIEYIYFRGHPVMINSTRSNALFRELIENRRVPGLEAYRLVKREPAYGRHRFDFLLAEPDGGERPLELKSCTLAHGGIASFPDAVSERAARHVKLLAEHRGILVFFLLHEGIRRFVPNYHTDFAFYRALKRSFDSLTVLALSVEYDENLSISRLLPVSITMPEVEPKGSYILVYRNTRRRRIVVGALGTIAFDAGYYLYCGSGMGDLFARIERHRRKSPVRHWHVDYLKDGMTMTAHLPVVGDLPGECGLAAGLASLGGESVPGFGSSDCRCGSHLFHFSENPMEGDRFWDLIGEARFGEYRERS